MQREGANANYRLIDIRNHAELHRRFADPCILFKARANFTSVKRSTDRFLLVVLQTGERLAARRWRIVSLTAPNLK